MCPELFNNSFSDLTKSKLSCSNDWTGLTMFHIIEAQHSSILFVYLACNSELFCGSLWYFHFLQGYRNPPLKNEVTSKDKSL